MEKGRQIMSLSRNAAIWVSLLAGTLFGGSPLSAQTCPSEIQFINLKPIPAKDGALNLSLLSTVSKPAANCLPAEIRIMAAFYDSDENLICSGIIESVVLQSSNLQSTVLELRPLNVVEFVRQKLAPNPPPKRLFCLNPEGNVEVSATEIAHAASLRVRATILPKNGGIATSEIRILF